MRQKMSEMLGCSAEELSVCRSNISQTWWTTARRVVTSFAIEHPEHVQQPGEDIHTFSLRALVAPGSNAFARRCFKLHPPGSVVLRAGYSSNCQERNPGGARSSRCEEGQPSCPSEESTDAGSD